MQKYGFVYIWFDRKHKRYYIGSHWGKEDDSYICSSTWMRNSYNRRKRDFKRRIIIRVYTNRQDLLNIEHEYLTMIPDDQLGKKYYNLTKHLNGHWTTEEDKIKTVGQKISEAKRGKSNGPRSQEVKDKIKETKRSRSYIKTPEMLVNMSNAQKGKKQSEETKRKKSESLKLAYAEGRKQRGNTPGYKQIRKSKVEST